jgi:hypothetical protein
MVAPSGAPQGGGRVPDTVRYLSAPAGCCPPKFPPPSTSTYFDAARDVPLAFTTYVRNVWRQIRSNNPRAEEGLHRGHKVASGYAMQVQQRQHVGQLSGCGGTTPTTRRPAALPRPAPLGSAPGAPS